MELLISFLIIVVAIYLVSKKASGKSSQRQAKETENNEEGLMVSSGPGASISITIEGAGYKSSQTRHKSVNPDVVWIAKGKSVKVAGKKIPGGMLYVGNYLQSDRGYYGVEPALINPKLKVNWFRSDYQGSMMNYWPSYSQINPACRAAYLNWLANGRNDPNIYIGYVFLFFYGLERRVFADAKKSKTAQSEIPIIVEEVKRLLGIYGSNHSFYDYANNLLDAVLLMRLPKKVYEITPPEKRSGWELPVILRLGLGQLVSEGKPIPTNWAYSWVMLHPETRLRTPATRCKDDFKKLFNLKYISKYGDGMTVKPNKTLLKATYSSASDSLDVIEIPCGDIPDVGRLSTPVNRLRTIVEECTNSLDPLSRFLGRKPDHGNSLEALALLPEDLLNSTDHPQYSKVQDFLNKQIGERHQTHIEAKDLVEMWPSSKDDRLSKKESISLARMLEKFGYGIAPDPRFGGKNLTAEGQAVLFRLSKDAPKVPSKEYNAAALLLHLAATVSNADGVVAESERNYLETHLEKALKMSNGEKARIRAHLDWLLHDPPGLAGIKKRVETLTNDEKRIIGAFCVGVAGADGYIDPSEIKILTKLYPTLGLPANDVYTHIHSMMSSTSVLSAEEPVTIQTADEPAKGYSIPSMPYIEKVRTKGIDLDMDVIQAKIKETAKITQILGDIFQQEVEEVVIEPEEKEMETVGLLDTDHSKLLRALIEHPEWSRADFELLVEKYGLLPEGALDMINEAAYEICNEPLIEGDDPITVEMEVAKEILA